jgi:hypothetical protein
MNTTQRTPSLRRLCEAWTADQNYAANLRKLAEHAYDLGLVTEGDRLHGTACEMDAAADESFELIVSNYSPEAFEAEMNRA